MGSPETTIAKSARCAPNDPSRPRCLAVLMSIGLATSALALCGSAQAQQTISERMVLAPRLTAFGQLGVFGRVRASSGDLEATDDLEPGGGAGIGVEIPLVPMFSIGAELTGWMWSSDGGDALDLGSSFLVDLSVVPRLRFPWSTSGTGHGVIALAVPIGPTIGVLNDDVQDGLAVLGSGADTGMGLHVGAMVNGQFLFTQRFGITVDAGYLHHFVWHQISSPLGGREAMIDMGQMVGRLGIIVAL
jgi:hypothetical protein